MWNDSVLELKVELTKSRIKKNICGPFKKNECFYSSVGIIYLKYLGPHRADGGVCRNNFVMQMTSDLINANIERPVNIDMSCLGAASLAGLAVGMCGFYKSESCLGSCFLPIAFLFPNHRIIERLWKTLVFIKLHTHMHITHRILLWPPLWVGFLPLPSSFLHSFSQNYEARRINFQLLCLQRRKGLWVNFQSR